MKLSRLPLVAACCVASVAGQSAGAPDAFAVYFGRPGHVNGAASTADAAAAFGSYARVALAPGIESIFHPDHAAAQAVIAAAPDVAFFGTIPVRAAGYGPTAAQLAFSTFQWAALGARGVLLTEFGYEHGVTRARQNLVVDFAHGAGLTALAAVSDADDALSPAIEALNAAGGGNPTGLPTHLVAGDRLLLAGFVVADGVVLPPTSFLGVAAEAAAACATAGVLLDVATTTLLGAPASAADDAYAWWCAAAFAADGFARTEPAYSAADDLLPFRPRPVTPPLGAKAGAAVADLPHDRLWGLRAEGVVRVDLALETGSFEPARVVGPAVAPVGAVSQWTLCAQTSPNAAYLAALSGGVGPTALLLDGRPLPLAIDPLFLLSVGGDPAFVGFAGALDAAGVATASLAPPLGAGLEGYAFLLAFAVVDPFEWSGIGTFSQAFAATVR